MQVLSSGSARLQGISGNQQKVTTNPQLVSQEMDLANYSITPARTVFLKRFCCVVDGQTYCVPALYLFSDKEGPSSPGKSKDQPVLLFDKTEIKTIYGCVRIAQKAIFDSKSGIAKLVETNGRKAVKIFEKKKIQNTRISEDYVTELKIQKYLSDPRLDHGHPDVMPVDCILDDIENIYVILPYASGGELFEFVASSGAGVPERKARDLFRHMVTSVAYIHSKNVCHRDVSLENFVLSGEMTPIMIDFGLAATMQQNDDGSWQEIEYTQAFGKPAYLSPEFYLITHLRAREIKKKKQLGDTTPVTRYSYDGSKQDVWALGVCLWMTLFASPPWKVPYKRDPRYYRIVFQSDLRGWLLEKGFEKTVCDVDGKNVEYWEWKMHGVRLSEAAVDLLQKLLQQEPERRCTAEEILQHEWFSIPLLPNS
mmetsp:Transcript_9173/g.10476  ORF Transcript_9173/g.10476 Transcript_9173/m.10476 type:complete len:424 (+) Transcript_9173:471-1742(+)|eukprot:CAMPEP_0184019478 /NCGR_PEP_ID=MMETSP0954-20121128/8777_1 /TAXON_ID=627963 /ORGANISM="Aplanochytrium sp, Strain PBS07" /LENGTH=423 /DNA_ID=CAMNT_0026301155 /DNA_START=482 /DNA_END=1753 /DNA_ORIENTATION=+